MLNLRALSVVPPCVAAVTLKGDVPIARFGQTLPRVEEPEVPSRVRQAHHARASAGPDAAFHKRTGWSCAGHLMNSGEPSIVEKRLRPHPERCPRPAAQQFGGRHGLHEPYELSNPVERCVAP